MSKETIDMTQTVKPCKCTRDTCPHCNDGRCSAYYAACENRVARDLGIVRNATGLTEGGRGEVKHDMIEALAEVWRELGQPSIEGLYFVADHGSGWDQRREMLGIPVLVGIVAGDVPLMLVGEDVDYVLASRFTQIARGVIEPIPTEGKRMYSIRKRIYFEAAHRLVAPYEGTCSALHGHSYMVDVTLAAETLTPTGMVCDFSSLAPLKHYIKQRLDHGNVNDTVEQPTVENIARHLFDVATEYGLPVKSIRVWETATAWGEYSQ
jgi:6-pyruvoyltetrahydropterin/6-carboxytetrahydropterin synthase